MFFFLIREKTFCGHESGPRSQLLHKITRKDLFESQIAHSESFRELYHRSLPTHENTPKSNSSVLEEDTFYFSAPSPHALWFIWLIFFLDSNPPLPKRSLVCVPLVRQTWRLPRWRWLLSSFTVFLYFCVLWRSCWPSSRGRDIGWPWNTGLICTPLKNAALQ